MSKPTYVTIGYSTVSIHRDGKGLRIAFVEVQVPEEKALSVQETQPAHAYDERGREVRFDDVVPLSRGLFI